MSIAGSRAGNHRTPSHHTPLDARVQKCLHWTSAPLHSSYYSKNNTPRHQLASTTLFRLYAAQVDNDSTDSHHHHTSNHYNGESTNWGWSSHTSSSQNQPLHKLMRQCTSALEFSTLIQQHKLNLTSVDVAVAWQVATIKGFLSKAEVNIEEKNHQKRQQEQDNLANELLKLTLQYAAAMDPASVSITAWSLASTSLGSESHLEALIEPNIQRLIQFQPSELCVLLWAASGHPSTTQETSKHLFNALYSLVIDHGMSLELFSAHDLSVLAQAVGKSQIDQPVLFTIISELSEGKFSDFTPSDMVRLLHGYASSNHLPSQNLVHLIAEYASANARRFSPENTSLLFLSLGKIQMDPGSKFIKKMSTRIREMIPETNKVSTTQQLKPYQVAHCCWGTARLEYTVKDALFLKKALVMLTDAPEDFSVKDINAIVWAFASAKVPVSKTALETIIKRLLEEVNSEKPSILAQAVSSLAVVALSPTKATANGTATGADIEDDEPIVVGVPPVCLLELATKTADRCALIVNELDSQDLGRLVVSLAGLKVPISSKTDVALRMAVTARVQQFAARLLPRLAWAAVRLGWRDVRVVNALADVTAERSGYLSVYGVSQAIWSFASLKSSSSKLTKALSERALYHLRAGRISPAGRARMAWADVVLARSSGVEPKAAPKLLDNVTDQDLIDMPVDSVLAALSACEHLTTPAQAEKDLGAFLPMAARHFEARARTFDPGVLRQAYSSLVKAGYKGPCLETIAAVGGVNVTPSRESNNARREGNQRRR